MSVLKIRYKALLQPVFGQQLRIDDSAEDQYWIVFILDGEREEFFFSAYGNNCVHLFWCNECFIFDKGRNALVSSDTHGEIVYEEDFEIERLPFIITDLILQLKDCTYISKKEIIKGKTPSGYDKIKDYIVTTRSPNLRGKEYKLSNITIEYV